MSPELRPRISITSDSGLGREYESGLLVLKRTRHGGGNGHLDNGGTLKRLHQAKKELAEEWKRQAAQLGRAHEKELRAQPAEIKEGFKRFYKRLPASKWDLLSGNYELLPLTPSGKGEDLSVVKSIGIGAGVGVAVLLIALAIIILISK